MLSQTQLGLTSCSVRLWGVKDAPWNLVHRGLIPQIWSVQNEISTWSHFPWSQMPRVSDSVQNSARHRTPRNLVALGIVFRRVPKHLRDQISRGVRLCQWELIQKSSGALNWRSFQKVECKKNATTYGLNDPCVSPSLNISLVLQEPRRLTLKFEYFRNSKPYSKIIQGLHRGPIRGFAEEK